MHMRWHISGHAPPSPHQTVTIWSGSSAATEPLLREMDRSEYKRRKREALGIGLGLSISRSIADERNLAPTRSVPKYLWQRRRFKYIPQIALTCTDRNAGLDRDL